jgi:hypothetical protein
MANSERVAMLHLINTQNASALDAYRIYLPGVVGFKPVASR